MQRPGERLREGSEMATGPGLGFHLHGAAHGGGRCDQLRGRKIVGIGDLLHPLPSGYVKIAIEHAH